MKQVSNWEERFDEEFCIIAGVPPQTFGLGEWINDGLLKSFIRAEIESAEQRGVASVLNAPTDNSHKGKLWSDAVQLAATAPFPEVAMQHVLKRVDEKAEQRGRDAAVDYIKDNSRPVEDQYVRLVWEAALEAARSPEKESNLTD